MDLSPILSPRSVEDILAERVRLVIGGEVYDLPALSIADNEAWLASVDADFVRLMVGLETAGDDVGQAVALLVGQPALMLAHLRSYDRSGILPPDDVVKAGLTPIGLLRAIGEVWRAANPLADIILAQMGARGLPDNVSQLPMSTSRRPTGGRRARSAAS